jgi:hypothetical protein
MAAQAITKNAYPMAKSAAVSTALRLMEDSEVEYDVNG